MLLRKFDTGLHPAGLDRNGLEPLAPVAVTLHHENGGIIKDPVKGAQQGGILAEELAPFVRPFIAREDHDVRTFFVIPAVDHVEEHPGALLIEDTPANLVNDQACGLDQVVDS